MPSNKIIHKEILDKYDLLRSARLELKKQFVGIDNIIDEVIQAVSSWFLFPYTQERPVIINLWGLTGVGKTALVNQLADLLKFGDRYLHFDLGMERKWGCPIREKLEDMYEHVNGFPVIIALDEFQHARTIDANANEFRETNRTVWQLIDSGHFQVSRNRHELESIYDLSIKLRHLLANGVRVKQGRVRIKKDYFLKTMDSEFDYPAKRERKQTPKETDVFFVPKGYHDSLYSMAKEQFTSCLDVPVRLSELDGFETLTFLENLLRHANSPKTVDCSKALVFVLGNLDEAYYMNDQFSPDMNADTFHEESLRITVPTIKRALQTRFRSEQIARLGNIHIIYPALSSQSYKAIIRMELLKIAAKTAGEYNIHLRFDDSISELIYQEGVYPAMGTRPLFTTIYQIVSSKLGRIMSERALNRLDASEAFLRVEKEQIVVDYYEEGHKVYSFAEAHRQDLGKLRISKKDDLQAIIAVHESGHAIVSCALLNVIPEAIYSKAIGGDNAAGFVYSKRKKDFIARKDIPNHLASTLGGYVAEKLIFGEENVTTGSKSDLKEATEFITQMLRTCGLGSVPGVFGLRFPEGSYQLYDDQNTISAEAIKWLNSAASLAETTLREEETLLLAMADYLSDHRYLDRKMIVDLLQKHGKNLKNMDFHIEGSQGNYRDQLKRQVATFVNNHTSLASAT